MTVQHNQVLLVCNANLHICLGSYSLQASFACIHLSAEAGLLFLLSRQHFGNVTSARLYIAHKSAFITYFCIICDSAVPACDVETWKDHFNKAVEHRHPLTMPLLLALLRQPWLKFFCNKLQFI